MQQPALGKKIAKLRKAAGFTQEELVEKCNLSARTLQRIEAGEVTPRSYTIKLIFSALGHQAYVPAQGFTGILSKATKVVTNGITKFCTYTIDLFNLKTQAMKKLTILSIFFFTFCAVIFTACLSTKKAANNQSSLVGTWQIMRNGVPDTTFDNKPGQIRYKTITGGEFIVTDIQFAKKQMYAAFSGSYTLDEKNKTYSELIEAAGNGYTHHVTGKINTFKYTLTDSLWYIKGSGYDEVWKRLK